MVAVLEASAVGDAADAVLVESFALALTDDLAEPSFCVFFGGAAAPVPLVVRRGSRSSVVAGIVDADVRGILRPTNGIRIVVEGVVVSTTAIRLVVCA